MFEVNLINSPGIQKSGIHQVISYRDESVPDQIFNSTSTHTRKTLPGSKWKLSFVIILPLIILAAFVWRYNFSQSGASINNGLSNLTSMSEVQFFTILNSIYEFKSSDVILENAEHTPIYSSISFVSKNQNMLNELSQRIESEFHHTGWISGDMTSGGRLLFRWNSSSAKPSIQTVYVSKSVIFEIFKGFGLECIVDQNRLTVEVSENILEDVLEKLDGLNHTLSVSFKLFKLENINDYKLVFEYL